MAPSDIQDRNRPPCMMQAMSPEALLTRTSAAIMLVSSSTRMISGLGSFANVLQFDHEGRIKQRLGYLYAHPEHAESDLSRWKSDDIQAGGTAWIGRIVRSCQNTRGCTPVPGTVLSSRWAARRWKIRAFPGTG